MISYGGKVAKPESGVELEPEVKSEVKSEVEPELVPELELEPALVTECNRNDRISW